MISPPSGATQNTAPGAVSDDGIEHDQPPCLVALDAFSGPLDLLLFLVRRAEVDVIDIPISDIADQFVATVAAWADLDLDLAGDFILMAATLLEIKARMIAPPSEEPVEEGADEEVLDLRSGLVAKLLAYRRCKEAALILAEREDERNHACTRQFREDIPDDPEEVGIDLENADPYALAATWESVLARIQGLGPRTVMADPLPLDTAMAMLVQTVQALGSERLSSLLATQSSRLGRVTLVMAVLECVRQHLMTVAQHGQYEEIELRFRPLEERTGETTLPPEVPDSGKRKRRPPLITIAGKLASDDTEPLADEVVESDEQRFMRELEEACALESVLARCSDLDSNFARFWALKRGLPWPPPELTVAPTEPAAGVAITTEAALPATTSSNPTTPTIPTSDAKANRVLVASPPESAAVAAPPELDIVIAANPAAAVTTAADPVPPLVDAAPAADASVAASAWLASTEPGEPSAEHAPLPIDLEAPAAVLVEPGESAPGPVAAEPSAAADLVTTDAPPANAPAADSLAVTDPSGTSAEAAWSHSPTAPAQDAGLTIPAPAPISAGADAISRDQAAVDTAEPLPCASPPDDQQRLTASGQDLPDAADVAACEQGLAAQPPAADPPAAALPEQDPSAAPVDRLATALADAVASPPEPPTPEADHALFPAGAHTAEQEPEDGPADSAADVPLLPAPAPDLAAAVSTETPPIALAAAPLPAEVAASNSDAAPTPLAATADEGASAPETRAQTLPAEVDCTPAPASAGEPAAAPAALDPAAAPAPDLLATAAIALDASPTPEATSATAQLPLAAADIWPEIELKHDGEQAQTTISPGSQAYHAARAARAASPSAGIVASAPTAGDEALSPTQQRTRATTLHAFPPAPVARRYHRQLALTATVALLMGTWYLSHHLASSHAPAAAVAAESGPTAPGPLHLPPAAQPPATVTVDAPVGTTSALGAAMQELVALPTQWPAVLALAQRLERWAASITPAPVLAPSPVFSSYAMRLTAAVRASNLAGYIHVLDAPDSASAPLVIRPGPLPGGAPAALEVRGSVGSDVATATALAHEPAQPPASVANAGHALATWMQQRPAEAIVVAQYLASILTGSAPVSVPNRPPSLPAAADQEPSSLRAMPYQRHDLMSSAAWLVLGAWRADADAP